MPGLRLHGPAPKTTAFAQRSPRFASSAEVEDGNVEASLQKAAKKLQKKATAGRGCAKGGSLSLSLLSSLFSLLSSLFSLLSFSFSFFFLALKGLG